MIISLLGIGSDTLLEDFKSSRIAYVRRRPPAGVVMNSAETVEIVNAAIAAVATVLIAWQHARASRKVIITLGNNRIIQTQGMGADEVARLLPKAKTILALETEKPDACKSQVSRC